MWEISLELHREGAFDTDFDTGAGGRNSSIKFRLRVNVASYLLRTDLGRRKRG